MKKKKIIKIVITVILSLILVLVVAAFAVFQFVIKPYTRELVSAVDQLLQDEEFMKDLTSELPAAVEAPDISQMSPDVTDPSTDLSQYHVNEDGTLASDTNNNAHTSQNTPQPKKPQSEYNSTYDYVKDNVDANDFKTGVSFASRIDIAYVLGLLKNGLTIPEKEELKIYLKERFTNEEINQGISLYNKYSYLLK